MKAVDTTKLSDSVTVRVIRHGPPTEKTVKPPVDHEKPKEKEEKEEKEEKAE